MKTKNFLLAAVLLISGLLSVNGVFAETTGPTDNVKLNIILQPIQTITVNPANTDVNIIYSSKDHYSIGTETSVANHLTVFSTGGFTVNVKSDGDFINSKGNDNKIDAADVKVTASGGLTGSEFATVSLATSEGSGSNLISSNKGGRDISYNVTYNNSAGVNNKYINHYVNGGDDKNTFTATITYTIAAK